MLIEVNECYRLITEVTARPLRRNATKKPPETERPILCFPFATVSLVRSPAHHMRCEGAMDLTLAPSVSAQA